MTGADASHVRVLVADHSLAGRRLLVSLCEHDPQIRVVGEARDGREAAELTLRLSPSLVLMDVSVAALDGAASIDRVMREAPTPIIIVSGDGEARDDEVGDRAVRQGALRVLPRPTGAPGTPAFEASARHLVSMVKALSDVKVIRRRSRAPQGTVTRRYPALEIVGVAASTGGPPALHRLLELLPEQLGAPVVVVQHIVEGFLPGMVSWLDAQVSFTVTVAEHGQRLEAGTVYVAGDGRHLEVDSQLRARLSDAPPVAGFRPSATVLFHSLAESFGPTAVGVVLTGMGTDGLEGLRDLRRAGGRVLAQDQDSSVVNGMPGAVVNAGLAHVVGPVSDLAADISAAANRRQQ